MYVYKYVCVHENSVGLSLITIPDPNLAEAIPVPAQAHLYDAKGGAILRCPTLRTRGGRLKSVLIHGNTPYPPIDIDMDTKAHDHESFYIIQLVYSYSRYAQD